MKIQVDLEVHQVDAVDVYKDIARIHQTKRGNIPEGKICRFWVGKKSRLLAVRGLSDKILGERKQTTVDDFKNILLDEVTRDRLKLTLNETYTFKIRSAGWLGQFWWAWRSSDPGYRIATRLGVISLLLGLIAAIPWADWFRCLRQYFFPN